MQIVEIHGQYFSITTGSYKIWFTYITLLHHTCQVFYLHLIESTVVLQYYILKKNIKSKCQNMNSNFMN